MRTLVVSFDELMATLHSGEQQLSLNDLNFAHIYRLKAWLMRHWQSVIRNHGSSSPVARIAKPEQMTYLAIWKDLLLSNFPVINLFWPWPTPPSRPTPTWWWRRSMRLGDRMADSCLFSALIHYSHWRIVCVFSLHVQCLKAEVFGAFSQSLLWCPNFPSHPELCSTPAVKFSSGRLGHMWYVSIRYLD